MKYDLRIGNAVIRHFIVRGVLLVALCMGAVTVWKYFHGENVPITAFRVHVPPTPITPTREQILRLPYNDEYLHVKLLPNGSVDLNSIQFDGPDAFHALGTKLKEVFDNRVKERVFDEEFSEREDLPVEKRIVRKIVLSAAADKKYGDVIKLIDEIKGSGMDDIWLQIDSDNYWWEFKPFLS